MSNYFEQFDWKTMMSLNEWPDDPASFYDIKKYHKILSPDYPEFIDKYIALPILSRLKGVGLLCGTDWTTLYKNRFYYSRLDHSVGVALIIWHFTHDKAQTLAGLFHDASTPVFSHVSDFRKGDALTQTATESDNERLLKSDAALCSLLAQDGLTVNQICDYHIYPVADNEIPQLSADRLEYMFPSGMALDGSWNLASIERAYNDITVLKNEDGVDELGFKTLEIAEDYCRRFCMIGHILQLNENKLTLHMLGQIMNQAVENGVLHEEDFMNKSESEIMKILDQADDRLYKTFRTMTHIEHTEHALPQEEYFSISLNVKQRYIDPLVKDCRVKPDNDTSSVGRLSAISPFAHKLIYDFKNYHDTPFGCVKLV
jgi:HD superfamily phosphohydrolase